MNRFSAFEIQAIAYAVFWLFYNLRGVRVSLKPYDESRAQESVENLITAAKQSPSPRLLPGVYSAIWLIEAGFDVIGFALTFSFINENTWVIWIIKILAVIVILENVQELRDLISDLQVMKDEEMFREQLLSRIKLDNGISIYKLGKWARLFASVALLILIYMWGK